MGGALYSAHLSDEMQMQKESPSFGKEVKHMPIIRIGLNNGIACGIFA
jgi:hypothetical protein